MNVCQIFHFLLVFNQYFFLARTSSGRPAKVRPLHKGRTKKTAKRGQGPGRVVFSRKRGPNPGPHSSLLKGLSNPIEAALVREKEDDWREMDDVSAFFKAKVKSSEVPAKLYNPDSSDGKEEIPTISRVVIEHMWSKPHHLRADELDMLLVRILQSLSHTLGLGVVIVPQDSKSIADLLREVSWLDSCDDIPIKEDGSVSSLV